MGRPKSKSAIALPPPNWDHSEVAAELKEAQWGLRLIEIPLQSAKVSTKLYSVFAVNPAQGVSNLVGVIYGDFGHIVGITHGGEATYEEQRQP